MRYIGEFTPPVGATVRRGDIVILRTERGLENGEVLCPATPQAVAAIPEPTKGEIVRVATPEDRAKIASVAVQQKQQYDGGTKLVAQHKLAMQIGTVTLFDFGPDFFKFDVYRRYFPRH